MKTGIEIIAEERRAHFTREGFNNARDDAYVRGELAEAASCYAASDVNARGDRDYYPTPARTSRWPWSMAWWKPTPDDRVRELAKAGALIAAEIDRLLRKANVSKTAKLVAKELP